MYKLSLDYYGFLKFIRKANQEVISWFGPHCNYDPSRIALMAAREWDGMADSERQFFIKSNKAESRRGSSPGSHPFLCYLLHKRHSNFLGTNRPSNNGLFNQSLFHPKLNHTNATDWMAMPETEREKYANMKLADLSIDHVIKKRDKLHEMYEPKELTILEFILKTRPKMPISARTWFITFQSLRVNSQETRERWLNLSDEDRKFYDVCARLDKKRFSFEKNAWLAKLLSIDFDSDDLSLSDFESIKAKTDIETIGGLIEMNKSLLPNYERLKRPLGPFSLFVRDYRYQIRNNAPEFRFGRHLKETSEAWAKLPEEERQFYKDVSNEMREAFNQANGTLEADKASDREICHQLFKHKKSVTGPSKPSHLVVRVPHVVDIYGKAMNIKKQDRKESWNSLSDADKEPYINEHKLWKLRSMNERAQMKAKLNYIDILVRKSEELERAKKELHLLRARNRAIKGIYD